MCRQYTMGNAVLPTSLPVGNGNPILIQRSSGPQESSPETERRSVQPFLQGAVAYQTDRLTLHHATGSSVAIVRTCILKHSIRFIVFRCIIEH